MSKHAPYQQYRQLSVFWLVLVCFCLQLVLMTLTDEVWPLTLYLAIMLVKADVISHYMWCSSWTAFAYCTVLSILSYLFLSSLGVEYSYWERLDRFKTALNSSLMGASLTSLPSLTKQQHLVAGTRKCLLTDLIQVLFSPDVFTLHYGFWSCLTNVGVQIHNKRSGHLSPESSFFFFFFFINDMITALRGAHTVMCSKKNGQSVADFVLKKGITTYLSDVKVSVCPCICRQKNTLKYNSNNRNFFPLTKHANILLLCFNWLNCCLTLSFCSLVLFKSFCWHCRPVLLLWVCVNDITQSAQSFGRTTDWLKFLCPQLSWSLQGCFQQSCLPVMSLTSCPHQNTHYRRLENVNQRRKIQQLTNRVLSPLNRSL